MNILLMAPPPGEGSGASSLIMLLLIFVVFYFFMIRPQIRRSKQQKQYRENLAKGDKIVTIGGIHAKIAEVNDTTFIIETESGVRFKIEKSAVAMDPAAIGKQA